MQVFELDSQFHELMYAASGSKMLNHILSDFHMYVTRMRKSILSSDSRSKNSTEEHRAILDAMRVKDENLIRQLTNEHVLNARNNIISLEEYNKED